jgi:hypothetical protein
MTLKRTDRIDRREGEPATRTCNVCGLEKPVIEFYVRRAITPSIRKIGEKRGKKKFKYSTRLSSCIVCNNDKSVKVRRMKWLRTLTVGELREEERKALLLLEHIHEAIRLKATGAPSPINQSGTV